MPRVVSLYHPTWSTDRVRRKMGSAAPSAETPLVLIGHEGRRRSIVAADIAAFRAGLRIGMPVTKAQALVPGLVTMDADPAAGRTGSRAASPLGAATLRADHGIRSARWHCHRRERCRASSRLRRCHDCLDGRTVCRIRHRGKGSDRRQLGCCPCLRALSREACLRRAAGRKPRRRFAVTAERTAAQP